MGSILGIFWGGILVARPGTLSGAASWKNKPLNAATLGPPVDPPGDPVDRPVKTREDSPGDTLGDTPGAPLGYP